MDVNFSHFDFHSAESPMPNSPFTGKKPIQSARSSVALRYRHGASPGSLPLHAMSARKAWLDAVRAREAVQKRIVQAFRCDVEGTGPGPSESDLELFARLAVAEQRMKRDFGRAKVQWPCHLS
jgi:hypothetical protein